MSFSNTPTRRSVHLIIFAFVVASAVALTSGLLWGTTSVAAQSTTSFDLTADIYDPPSSYTYGYGGPEDYEKHGWRLSAIAWYVNRYNENDTYNRGVNVFTDGSYDADSGITVTSLGPLDDEDYSCGSGAFATDWYDRYRLSGTAVDTIVTNGRTYDLEYFAFNVNMTQSDLEYTGKLLSAELCHLRGYSSCTDCATDYDTDGSHTAYIYTYAIGD